MSRIPVAVRGRIDLHRRWILRVYFVALSVASIRVVAAVIILLTGQTLQQVLGVAFAIAFVMHTLVVEAWVWARQQKCSDG